ncbi:hypothetical protein ACJW30_01G212300 [Castanea mollissima]
MNHSREHKSNHKKGLIKHRYSRRVSGYIDIQITPTCINKSQPISHYKTSLFKPTWRRRKKTQIIHHRGKKNMKSNKNHPKLPNNPFSINIAVTPGQPSCI